MKLGSDSYEEVRGMLRTGSSRHAAELVRLGWTFVSQYPEDEPAEIRLRWTKRVSLQDLTLIRKSGERHPETIIYEA
jgi:hypothetical protein